MFEVLYFVHNWSIIILVSMSVLAERSEKCQLELLRQYYNDKGVEVDKNGVLLRRVIFAV